VEYGDVECALDRPFGGAACGGPVFERPLVKVRKWVGKVRDLCREGKTKKAARQVAKSAKRLNKLRQVVFGRSVACQVELERTEGGSNLFEVQRVTQALADRLRCRPRDEQCEAEREALCDRAVVHVARRRGR
jgi:hypothetical protein